MASRRARPLEKAVQAQIVATARSVGGQAWNLGTVRRGSRCPKCATFVPPHYGTQQGEGLADVFMVLPIRDVTLRATCEQAGLSDALEAVWWECKRAGERLRPEQRTFRDYCRRTLVTHGWGDLDAFVAFLVQRGLVKADNVPHYRRPTVAAAQE